MTGPAEGGCGCGAVRYRLLAAPETVNCCHCRDCQRITGSAFALNGVFAREHVEVTAGVDALATDDGAIRCAACRTLLWALHPMFGDATLFVRLGTLDRAEQFAPTAHYFTRSKHPWVTIPSGLPQYETLPERPG